MVAAVAEMFGYLNEVIADRHRHPTDDLLGRLVTLNTTGDDAVTDEPLNTAEMVLFAILLLVAGNETTTNLIGNGYHALLNHPDQATRLRQDPGQTPAAIEGVLRYDTPAQGIFRGVTTNTTLAGTPLEAGSIILILIAFGAANRDPAHYDDPHRYQLDRNPTDHVGFGHGIHHCMGAALARLELRIVAETVLARTRSIEPTDTPTRSPPNPILRGYAAIPVHATGT